MWNDMTVIWLGLGQFPRRRVGVRRVDLGSFRDATDVIGWRYDHAAARP